MWEIVHLVGFNYKNTALVSLLHMYAYILWVNINAET